MTSEDGEENRSSGIPNAPIIFQCSSCLTIIGDSFNMVCTDHEMETISLSGVSNVLRSETESTSGDGPDRGCTFVVLLCSHCQKIVGRIYIGTSKPLDHVRDLFTLHSNSIVSYTLGTSDFTTARPQNAVFAEPEVDLRVFKMQNVILSLSERIAKLEDDVNHMKVAGQGQANQRPAKRTKKRK